MKHEVPPQSERPPAGGTSASPARWHLDRIVAELRVSREETHSIRRDGEARRAPSRDALEAILNGLTEALFPRHYGQSDLDGENIDYFVGNTLSIVLRTGHMPGDDFIVDIDIVFDLQVHGISRVIRHYLILFMRWPSFQLRRQMPAMRKQKIAHNFRSPHSSSGAFGKYPLSGIIAAPVGKLSDFSFSMSDPR
jgi:hypothetical protein